MSWTDGNLGILIKDDLFMYIPLMKDFPASMSKCVLKYVADLANEVFSEKYLLTLSWYSPFRNFWKLNSGSWRLLKKEKSKIRYVEQEIIKVKNAHINIFWMSENFNFFNNLSLICEIFSYLSKKHRKAQIKQL